MRRYTDAQLVDAIEASHSWRGVLRALGLSATSAAAMRSVRLPCGPTGTRLQPLHRPATLDGPRSSSRRSASADQLDTGRARALGLAGGSSTTTLRGHAVRLGLDTAILRAQSHRVRQSCMRPRQANLPRGHTHGRGVVRAVWSFGVLAPRTQPLRPSRLEGRRRPERIQVKTDHRLGRAIPGLCGFPRPAEDDGRTTRTRSTSSSSSTGTWILPDPGCGRRRLYGDPAIGLSGYRLPADPAVPADTPPYVSSFDSRALAGADDVPRVQHARRCTRADREDTMSPCPSKPEPAILDVQAGLGDVKAALLALGATAPERVRSPSPSTTISCCWPTTSSRSAPRSRSAVPRRPHRPLARPRARGRWPTDRLGAPRAGRGARRDEPPHDGDERGA